MSTKTEIVYFRNRFTREKVRILNIAQLKPFYIALQDYKDDNNNLEIDNIYKR